MHVQSITSAHNPLLKQVRALHERHGREKLGLFLLEGEKLCLEAFQKGLELDKVLTSTRFWQEGINAEIISRLSTIYIVDDQEFAQLATTQAPCRLMATARIPKASLELDATKPDDILVVAHSIQDPGNLGTMIRTAYASGVKGMILSKGTADPYNPKTVRAAMGALFDLPLRTHLSAREIVALAKQSGYRLVALDASAPETLFDFEAQGPTAFIFGNEGQGLNAELLQGADQVVSIPMNAGCESLNVAASCAIVLFNIRQKRWQKDKASGAL